MYLLDTDLMTLLEREGPGADLLKARLASVPLDDLATTIISYEEQTRGWLAFMSRSRTESSRIEAFRRLKRHIEVYCKLPIVEYNEAASSEFQRLRHQQIRGGTRDLQIAAIALANDAIVLTRNLSDFRLIPGVRAEDWSA